MKTKRVVGVLAVSLMMLMMLSLQTINIIKLLLLVAIFPFCIKNAKITNEVWLICLPLCLSTLWGCVIGIFKNTEFPFYALTVGLLWPVLSLFVMSALLKKECDFRTTIKYMFIMHIVVMGYDTLFALSVILGFPMINLYPETESAFSYYETMARMNFDNLNVLTFTTPLFFILWLTRYDFGISRKIQFIVVLFNFFFLIFCGRRSLVAVFLLTPIFTFFLRGSFPSEVRKVSMRYLAIFIILIVCIVGYVFVAMPEVFDSNINNFLNAFDSDAESTKFVQREMLLKHFYDSPIVGTGSGAVFYEPARGIRQHQWELTYYLALATKGIIGFILYVIGVVGVLLVGFKYARRRNDILFSSILFAYFFIILANATNPVLCSFDLMLPLYLCYARLNYSIISEKRRLYER